MESMYHKEFPLSRFSPPIQEMCRLPHCYRYYGDTTEPIDYINRFSFTNADIPDLLEIAGWLEQEIALDDCLYAPLHAWEALALLDPIQTVPGMLDLLNRIDWGESEYLFFFQDVLAAPGIRSALKALKTGNASLDTIPLFLAAMGEKERHSATHAILVLAVGVMACKFPEHLAEFYRILLDDLKELRIGCREWYVEAVCDLAFMENPPPELAALLNKACREGYVETERYWSNDGLKDTYGFDYENDAELLALHEKSEEVSDILRTFRYCGNTFPLQAVQKARELRDWIIPNLIEVVRDTTAYARFHVRNNSGIAQFAVHLLAEFQATEALPVIFDSLSLTTDELWDYMYNDGLYESMPGIVYRLVGDKPEFYDQKLRNPQTPVALWICLAQSLRYLVTKKIVSWETYGSWLRDYLELAIQSENKEIVTDVICDIIDTANPGYIPLVRSAFEKGLVDEIMMSLEYAESELQNQILPREKTLPDPMEDFDTVKELGSWAWFQEDDEDEDDWDIDDEDEDLIFDYLIQQHQPKAQLPLPANSLPKVGRNDPCPCGSGKKYKVCCLKK